jgi:AmmeMemoRadiSam system protein B
LEDYRNAPHRKPAHAGDVYPENPDELSKMLNHFCNGVTPTKEPPGDPDSIVGILSPHIDYQRGGDVYAKVWKQASPLLQEVELAIILGTDHYGSPGKLTLTRQDYATPWGVLPTNQEVVDALADAFGPEDPFAEEIHHINEHSIELALVWLHHFLGSDTSCSLVPILCGSFAHITNPDAVKADSNPIEKAIPVLKKVLQERKAIVVAAADLAHVGPNFGDDIPVDLVGKAKLGAEDSASLGAISRGDAGGFLQLSVEEMDKRRICGLPPIYMMLRLLDGAQGEILSYSQCPADQANASFVSIAGVLLYK